MRLLAVVITCALAAPAAAGTVTGYQSGQKSKIKVVDVGNVPVEVRTAKAYRVMEKAARKAGVQLAVRSGFRTHAKQKKLYREYRRGVGNLAARPGYSQHENGRALDLVVTEQRTYQWLIAHANQYGFHRTVRGEPWHWEYLGGDELTGVELGVSRHADAGAGDDRDEPCTRDWGFARAPHAPPDEPEVIDGPLVGEDGEPAAY